jgi:hypothetical protein
MQPPHPIPVRSRSQAFPGKGKGPQMCYGVQPISNGVKRRMY